MAARKPPADGGNGEGASAPSENNDPPKSSGANAELRTPREWAKVLNANPAHHAPAAFLHGWGEHEHHLQDEPLEISEEDYRKAIKCALDYPCSAPHEPAMTPLEHIRSKFARFSPAKKSETDEASPIKRGGPRPVADKAGKES